MASTLTHLIYSSAATKPFSANQLEELLGKSRSNNARQGITGMLLHVDGSFFQVLEGEAADVDAAYARIEQDSRHAQHTIIVREPIARRSFGDVPFSGL